LRQSTPSAQAELEEQLTGDIARFFCDPLGFVRYAFPWREPGTDLEYETGPDTWQTEVLRVLGEKVAAIEARRATIESAPGGLHPKPDQNEESEALSNAIKIAVASGHGVGKSALVAWLVLWFMSTRPHPQIVVTANTGEQLNSKTWRELARWHKRLINAHWFNWTATKFYAVDHPETWAARAITWSVEHSEAFAGTHEEHVLVIFDEASAIEDVIWEVSEGALTTPGAIFVAFGNPTRNTGRFCECWGKFRHRYYTLRVDSREAKKADRGQIQQWIEDYGEDSDFVRVRVRGEFPRAGDTQFIATDLVEAAMARRLGPEVHRDYPIIIGVDPAYMGGDQSVIVIRQGRKLLELRKYREMDGIQLAGQVCRAQDEWRADHTFIDRASVGASCVDQLTYLGRGFRGVDFGGKADDERTFLNKRAEMWGRVKEWLQEADLPDDTELRDDLIGPEYGFTPKNQVQLESKKDMKKRGLSSPDSADALALTFAFLVGPKRTDNYDYSRFGQRQQKLRTRNSATGY